jgi:hypothetical protein
LQNYPYKFSSKLVCPFWSCFTCTIHRLREGEAVFLKCLPLLHMPKQVSVCTGMTKWAHVLSNWSKSWCYIEMVAECARPPVPVI